MKNSELIEKQISGAPVINDTILLQRFKKFKENPINYNGNDDDDDDSNDSGNNPAGLPPPPPTLNDFSDFFSKPKPFLLSSPPPPPSQKIFSTPQIPTQPMQNKPNIFDKFSSAAVTPGEEVMSEFERVVEKEKVKEEIEQITPSDPSLEYFNNVDQILNSNFILQKEKDEHDLKKFNISLTP